jgi:hypothetical protein
LYVPTFQKIIFNLLNKKLFPPVIRLRSNPCGSPGLLGVGCMADNLLWKTTELRNLKKQWPDCPKYNDLRND